jgi:hypothetical protein
MPTRRVMSEGLSIFIPITPPVGFFWARCWTRSITRIRLARLALRPPRLIQNISRRICASRNLPQGARTGNRSRSYQTRPLRLIRRATPTHCTTQPPQTFICSTCRTQSSMPARPWIWIPGTICLKCICCWPISTRQKAILIPRQRS